MLLLWMYEIYLPKTSIKKTYHFITSTPDIFIFMFNFFESKKKIDKRFIFFKR